VGVGGAEQVFPQGQVRLGHLRLGEDQQVAPAMKEHIGAGEQLHVAALACGRLARALGDGPQLAVARGEDGQQAVGLAEVHAAEDDRLGAEGALFAHQAVLTAGRLIGYPPGF